MDRVIEKKTNRGTTIWIKSNIRIQTHVKA